MATLGLRCRLSSTLMWLCLFVVRAVHSQELIGDDNQSLLFAPRRPLVDDNPFLSVICVWRGSSHLCPLLSTRSLRRPSSVPVSYWLLLLAGDVAVHPGPVKFPCIECS